jgi:hypothetical protein
MKKELRRRFSSNRVITDYSGTLRQSFGAMPEMEKVLNVVSSAVNAVSMDASQVVTGVDYNHVSDATVERVMNTYENLRAIIEGDNNGRKRLIDYSLLMYQIGNKLTDERVLKLLYDNGIFDNVEISNIKALAIDPTKPLTQMGLYLAMMTDLSAVLLKLFTADPTSNFDGVTLASQLMNDLSRFTEKEQIETAQLNTLFNAGVIDNAAMEVSRRNINTSILDPNGYDVYGNPLSHTATTYTGQNFQPQGNVIQNTYNPNTGYFTNNTQNGPQPVQVQPEQTKSGLLQSVNGYTGFETNAVMNNQSTTVTSYGAQPQQPQPQYQQPVQSNALYTPVMNNASGGGPINQQMQQNPNGQIYAQDEWYKDQFGNIHTNTVYKDVYGNVVQGQQQPMQQQYQQPYQAPYQNTGMTPEQRRNLYRTDLINKQPFAQPQYQQVPQQVQPQFQPQQQVQQQYPQNPQPMQQPMQQQYQPQYGQQPYGQQQQFPQFRVIQEFDNNDGNHVRVIEDVATGVVSIERTPLVNNNNRYHDAAVVSAAAIYS